MSNYLTALETELKHVEEVTAAAAEHELADLKARTKDIKAEIKRVSGLAGKVAADAKGIETAVAPLATEVA